jgi:ribonuclease VapC
LIAVDTSALLAILLREPQADACSDTLLADDDRVISAGTLAEALIVAPWRMNTTVRFCTPAMTSRRPML